MTDTAHILSLADRCVKCGLCLPQCPTYDLSLNENESPRGRIALIQGWLNGQLEASTQLIQHLDQCLECRRCEHICPSLVPYGEIITQAKIQLTTVRPIPLRQQLALKILLNKSLMALLIRLSAVLQRSGLLYLVKKSGLLKLFRLNNLLNVLPRIPARLRLKPRYPSAAPARGRIGLFTGCLSCHLDTETVQAAITLLTRLGYDVVIPPQQTCCGAMHHHLGDNATAEELIQHNFDIFKRQDVAIIVSLVNGCSGELSEYAQRSADNNAVSPPPQILDLIEFLADVDWPAEIRFKPLQQNLAVHVPCSLRNVLNAETKLFTLLKRLPGSPLPQTAVNDRCCGAAGSYFLRHPDIARQLATIAAKQVSSSEAAILLSSNLGCALQLQATLQQTEPAIKVMHPVVLLAQQLDV